MSRIAGVFNRKNRKALIPYVTVGYPDIEATLKVVPILAKSGADIIELGIPFSDPLADGATIQKASFNALNNGITPEKCLETARKLHKIVNTPLVFMSYYNPIYKYGIDKFCKECARSGIDGLIIPDLPPEEGDELEPSCVINGLDLIYLLAPTSTGARIKMVTAHSRGFVYLVSVTGVTGARRSVPQELADFIASVRKKTDKPLCVGFGISSPEQAAKISGIADGVIIGSRLVQLMEQDITLSGVASFCSEVRKSIDR